MLYILRAIYTHQQVHHQQTALIPIYKVLLHVSATVHSHVHGVSQLVICTW